MKTEDSNDVTVNMNVMKKLKYHVATPTFHQWRCDKRTVYGLNFEKVSDADCFKNFMTKILGELNCRQPTNVPNTVNKGSRMQGQDLATSGIGTESTNNNNYEQVALDGAQSNGHLHLQPQNAKPRHQNSSSNSQTSPDRQHPDTQKQQYQQYQQQNIHQMQAMGTRPTIPNLPNGHSPTQNQTQTQSTDRFNFDNDMMKELERIQDLEQERNLASQNRQPYRPQMSNGQSQQSLQNNLQSQLQSTFSHTNTNLQVNNSTITPLDNINAINGGAAVVPPSIPGGGPPPPPGPPPPNNSSLKTSTLQDQIKKQKSLVQNGAAPKNSMPASSKNSKTLENPNRPFSGGDFLSELTRKIKKKSDTNEPNQKLLMNDNQVNNVGPNGDDKSINHRVMGGLNYDTRDSVLIRERETREREHMERIEAFELQQQTQREKEKELKELKELRERELFEQSQRELREQKEREMKLKEEQQQRELERERERERERQRDRERAREIEVEKERERERDRENQLSARHEQTINNAVNSAINHQNSNHNSSMDYERMKRELKSEICFEMRGIIREELGLFLSRLGGN